MADSLTASTETSTESAAALNDQYTPARDHSVLHPTTPEAQAGSGLPRRSSGGRLLRPAVEKKHTPVEADDSEQAGDELSCVKHYFQTSLGRIYRLFKELNFVIVLMSWTALLSLVYAGLLCVTVPPDMGGKALSYLDALFFAVACFTASGLTTFDYYSFGTGNFFFMGVMITSGSIVLLTTLPAVLRYRALSKEREKLVLALEQTGLYGGGGVMSPGAPSPTTAGERRDVANPAGAAAAAASASVNTVPMLGLEGGDSAPAAAGPSASIASPSGTPASTLSMRMRVSSILYEAQSPVTAGAANNGANNGGGDATTPSRQVAPGFADSPTRGGGAGGARAVSAGQCIVYEDGLAHINQQIDICIFIMGGCGLYWFLWHAIVTILLCAAGRSFGWSLFNAVSAFNNAGYAMEPTSMTAIVTEPNANFIYFVLILCMTAGNALFPLFFRIMLSAIQRILDGRCCCCKDEGASLFGQPVAVWAHNLSVFLRSPRRYYTHLFSWRTTLTLVAVWFVLMSVGALLLIPEMRNEHVLHPNATSDNKFWIAVFQSVSVRSSGYSSVNLDRVSVAHDAWWVFAQYVSAYPFLLAVRGSSVAIQRASKKSSSSSSTSGGNAGSTEPAAARSADDTAQGASADGASAGAGGGNSSSGFSSGFSSTASPRQAESAEQFDDEDEDGAEGEQGQDEEADAALYQAQQQLAGAGDSSRIVTGSFVRREATNIFARDMFVLYLGLLIIMYLEQDPGGELAVSSSSAADFDTYNSSSAVGYRMTSLYLRAAFELTSAFGNVGLSLGVQPGVSFSGSLRHGFSVFVIIVVMYFGKHRGLPQSVDDAITFKVRVFDLGEELEKKRAAALSEPLSDEQRRARRDRLLVKVFAYYEHYNPSRLPKVDQILAAFEGNEEGLMRNLEVTWGPPPPPPPRKTKKRARLRSKVKRSG